VIEYIPHRCPPWLYNKAQCRLCVNYCPQECLEFKEGGIVINEERCTDCGICTTACPSGALRMHGFHDRDLLERLKDQVGDAERFVFTCSSGEALKKVKLHKGSSLIKVPCVGILKETHLIELFRSGGKEIWLRLSCDDCSSLRGREIMNQTAHYTRTLLHFLTIEGEVVISEDFPVVKKGKRVKPREILPAPHYSRRDFFSLFSHKVKSFNESKSGENEDGLYQPPDAELPEKREILLEMLNSWEAIRESVVKKRSFPLYQLKINDNCTLCDKCALFCPTGAINRIENNEEARIDFRFSFCVGCYQCDELCPEDALYSLEEIKISSLMRDEVSVLYKKGKKVCPQCEKPFLPRAGFETCISCHKRAESERRMFAVMGIKD
jgi:Pyruvate/2-oxoacid:ferredoxin oxidoreductase delta subunit/coenzyme F420-reducing hydrogenase delta subunit